MTGRLSVCLLCVVWCGCGADTDAGGATDGPSNASSSSTGDVPTTWMSSWGTTQDATPWNIDTENPPAPVPPVTGGDEDTEGDDESESEGGDDEGFVGWFGFGAVVPGESYAAGGEVIVYLDDVDHCVLIWTAASAVPDDAACPGCESAFRVTIGEVEAEVDEDCSLVDTDAASLPGTVIGLGWSGEALWVDWGEGYALAEEGFAEFEEARGEFFWELPLFD